MSTRTLWISPTDWVSGDATLRLSYPSAAHPATEITATAPGDLKWVSLALRLPPFTEIKAVRVCYQVSNPRSFISQVRLTEMTTPERALVRHDDATDLTNVAPTCYVSEVANLRAEGAITLALRLNFANRSDKIILGAVGIDLCRYAAAKIWTPDRRPVAVIRCYNGNKDNTYGLLPHWLDRGVPWLLEALETLWSRGFRRFMITLPAGRENLRNIPWPSAQWEVLEDAGIHTVSGSVRQDFTDHLPGLLADKPEAQVLFYLGFRIKSAYNRDMNEAEVPDLRRADHRRVVHANMDGFIYLTPDDARPQIGFRLDNSSIPDNRDGLVALSHWFRAQDVSIGGEAIPTEAGSNAPVLVERCPWFGLYRYHRRLDPEGDWTFDRASTEVGVGLHPLDSINCLDYWGGNQSELDRFRINDPAELVDEFRRRGCIFYIYYEFPSGAPVSDWESLVLATT